MNEMQVELDPRLDRLPKRSAEGARFSKRRVVRAAIVALFVLLFAGSFALAAYFVGNIRTQLEQIQAANQANVAELNRTLTELKQTLDSNMEQASQLQGQYEDVESELDAVKEEMSLAGDSLSTAAETKQALNERITDLSKELEELRKSIQKLEEAARVY